MSSLTIELSNLLGKAFIDIGLPDSLGQVRVSDRPDLAQFQCNGAMSAAKIARKNPRAIANEVIEKIPENNLITNIDVQGAGFINIKVSDEAISDLLAQMMESKNCNIDKMSDGANVIIDYGGPNVAKSMHVGHLRSSIIGESLKRLFRFAGYNALGDIHLGDWGTQMGMVISELEIMYPDWPYFDENYEGEYPKESPITIEDLEKIYPKASKACKEDELRKEKAKKATVELQAGRRGYRALWQHMVNVSIESMKGNFAALDVHFDIWNGESSVHDLIAPMVEEMVSKKWAVNSEGAIVIPVARNDDKKEVPPLILYKSDGAVMYGTTDLATIAERIRDYNPEKIIYVVDQRQNLHFEQVFRAARKCGIITGDDKELIFVGNGTMNGKDGKPFKTREGGVMRLEDLIAMGREKALTRLSEANLAEDMSDDEKNKIADMVGVAAIKFADLQNNPVSDYIFDIDRMTAFEGKTGPYLLYQAVRIKSLLIKAADAGFTPNSDGIMISDEDRDLALILLQFQDILYGAVRNLSPNLLCDYLHRLAQEFSSFYAKYHIISEKNDGIRSSRLALCFLTLKQLRIGLDLLGIKIPDRM